MSEIILSAGRLRATILPHIGAGIADFSGLMNAFNCVSPLAPICLT